MHNHPGLNVLDRDIASWCCDHGAFDETLVNDDQVRRTHVVGALVDGLHARDRHGVADVVAAEAR